MIRVNDLFDVPWQEGLTVQGVLDFLGWDYALITVTVNEFYVPPDEYSAHLVPDHADLRAIHIAHGG